ncbi:stepping stone isoform X2 [Lycorma delicatula]
MVASLQSRKEALESKLREKNEELKALCIQEAELTGVLPPETPIEPGESPPSFRRRVGTVFTYPENLINKLKSKEEESLAALELECKIQTGIAEAALGLANDGTASKSVRRKHRLMYQQSQRRLMELEARLSFLRQSADNNNSSSNSINSNNNNSGSNSTTTNNHNGNSSKGQLKQRKKPRPPLDSDGDCCDGIESGSSSQHQLHQHQPLSLSISDRGVLRHSHTYNSVQRYYDPHQPHRQTIRSHANAYTWQYHPSTSPDVRSGSSVNHIDREQGYYPANDGLWYHTAPNPSRSQHINAGHGHSINEDERSICNYRYRDRFGSLDRRRGGSGSSGGSRLLDEDSYDDRHLKTLMPNTVPAILLPNQTYPENSLMRTQSLGIVDHNVSRKIREKEWYETALDNGVSPRPPSPPSATPPPPPSPAPPSSQLVHIPLNIETNVEGTVEHRPVSQQVNFDTVVPFESPKNHTVVQAGKWQPYREVTKPFEMADFYKYSTKFRKNNSNNNNNINNSINNNNNSGGEGAPQHKGVYQPLQPMTCQPLLQSSPSPPTVPLKERRELPNFNNQSPSLHPPLVHLSQSLPPPTHSAPSSSSLADAFSSEMLAWYQDQNVTQPRSATFV